MSTMNRLEETMHITPEDNTSLKTKVNGYPVTLRFSATTSPDIYNNIRNLLLSSFTLDIPRTMCNNSPWKEPICTLKTEDNYKNPHLINESEDLT